MTAPEFCSQMVLLPRVTSRKSHIITRSCVAVQCLSNINSYHYSGIIDFWKSMSFLLRFYVSVSAQECDRASPDAIMWAVINQMKCLSVTSQLILGNYMLCE